jgi:uncharacterized protein YdeI (YjbR/CyaY-like superfamily)
MLTRVRAAGHADLQTSVPARLDGSERTALNARMERHDSRVDAYLAAAAPFARPILNTLRQRILGADAAIVETLKWSAPSYTYRGKILCSMAAFKQHASFGFWQHAQVMGEDATRAGAGSFGKLVSPDDLPPPRELDRLLRKAMALIDAGTPVPGVRKTSAPRPPPAVPPDLAAALQRDAAARRTFEGFAPGHRREYIDWVTEAKREETRAKRLAQAIEWLAEGKSRHWKYQDC